MMILEELKPTNVSRQQVVSLLVSTKDKKPSPDLDRNEKEDSDEN